LSARAACRLATLGFEEVYEYAPSKVDWMARGLPLEGERAAERRAIDFAGESPVTCALDDQIGAVRSRMAGSAYDFAVVLTGGVVMGRLTAAALAGDANARAEDAMEPGPPTSRPNLSTAKLLERLRNKGETVGILTDPEGNLLAVVNSSDLE
jgi:hypothetical protein